MIGQEFDSRQDVITCIKTAFWATAKRVLGQVFGERIQRVQWCIDHKDSYFSQ
jgi:hypothetical protein